jgi:hypothetical protein
MSDDEQVRRERARRLLEEIEALKSGRPPGPPRSPREFTDEQAHEQEQMETKARTDKGKEKR